MRFKDFCWSPEDLITQTKYIHLAKRNPNTHVFVFTDSIEHNCQTDYRGQITPPTFPPQQQYWITGMSDYSITSENSSRFDGLYKKWFAINVRRVDPNIVAVPIGVDTHSDLAVENENERIIYDVSRDKVKAAETLAYMNFNVYTWPQERGILDLFFSKLPWIKSDVNKRIPYKIYCENIRAHKFTFCPRGNGPDTHRFWESIYLGSIPIVLDYPEMATFFSKLPVLKVKSWLSVTEELLEIEYERISQTDYDFSIMRFPEWEKEILIDI
jgi:hypothetical protein